MEQDNTCLQNIINHRLIMTLCAISTIIIYIYIYISKSTIECLIQWRNTCIGSDPWATRTTRERSRRQKNVPSNVRQTPKALLKTRYIYREPIVPKGGERKRTNLPLNPITCLQNLLWSLRLPTSFLPS